MSEAHTDATEPLHRARDGGNESDLELFAIEDHFAEAFHSGAGPRLADYLRRYPQYADQLTEFASVFLPEATRDAEGAVAAYEAPSEVLAPELSPGTQRALDMIFTGLDAPNPVGETLLVAEEPAAYTIFPLEEAALARIHDVPLAALAEWTGLSREELAALARVAAQAPETLSPALVRRVAEALGISEAEAQRALAAGS